MTRVFSLALGQVGPLQQSAVSCGAACLVVARMMRDPWLAGWILDGPAGDCRAPHERFADLERRTMRRTNSVLAYPGRLQLPWPRSLGTSPWGAAAELEERSADPGHDYRIVPIRGLSPEALAGAFDAVVARAVSYTHLDVYKRQRLFSRSGRRMGKMRARLRLGMHL